MNSSDFLQTFLRHCAILTVSFHNSNCFMSLPSHKIVSAANVFDFAATYFINLSSFAIFRK
jgi:hypothetical protein